MPRLGDSLPTVTSGIPRDLRNYLDRLRGLLNNIDDTNVTTRKSLIELGLLDAGGNVIPSTPTGDYGIPPAVTGLAANGAFQNIILTWDQPQYLGHAFTEIWASPIYDTLLPDTDPGYVDPTTYATFDAETAVIVAITSGSVTNNEIGGSRGRYYWARNVNVEGTAGPFNSVTGVLGETAPDIDFLLDTLTDSITESQLYQDLGARIDLIDGGVGLVGSVAYQLAQEANARSQEILAASQELENLITSFTFAQDYDNAVTYSVGDLAVYSGTLYRAIATTTGNLPTNTTYWEDIGEFTSLAEIVGNNSSSIVQLNNVSAGSTSANASALFGLQSTVNDSETGLLATRATLLNDYYTAADTTSAIASATTGLASTTYVNNALGDYTTTANLIANYYTKTGADSAIASATSGLVSNTDLSTALGDYVTNASLTSDYYTKTDTDSAISSATTNLASTTYVNNALGNYTTTASLIANYYTKTGADSAIASATSGLASTTYVNNALGDYTTTATLTTNYYTKTATDSAISSAVSTLASTVGNNTAAIQASAESIDGLRAQYTVKIDNNGYVTGFGLASTPVDGTPFSEFIVRVDRFSVGSGNTDAIPFVVTTTTTTLNGVSVPAGVYIDQAYIKNGAISSAKIGNAAVDTAQIANAAITNAKINDLDATKINAGFISAARIQAGSISADKIAANSLTANQIAAGAISASELAISATNDGTANSIFMDAAGAIKVYDASGNLRVRLGNLST